MIRFRGISLDKFFYYFYLAASGTHRSTKIKIYHKGSRVILKFYKISIITIFKRFHSYVEGSGIGLYLVKRTQDKYGGHIQVESKEGVNFKFTIFIPQVH
ncbi:sensor histidine kinase [Adhaeribacter aquaticus]|uniref:sensor histidine kinase n=1 Tax=Adhaeribacter aquaticus TaxID=299567 RepID=UPI00047C8AE5|nr:ATP-binding protein [Adhaeribacter aquaticus]